MRLGHKVPNSTVVLGGIVGIALAHVLVLAFSPHRAIASNCVQFLAGALASTIATYRAIHSRDQFFRYTWMQLGMAFGIWSTSELLFTHALIHTQRSPVFPSIEDMLWLLFAFPILMVTVTRRSRSRWEWVSWLDSAQACIFFILLDALAFSHSPLLSFSTAYDVQATALLLSSVVRFYSSEPGQERSFFGVLTGYLATYALLTFVGIHFHAAGQPTGTWVDLCWAVPFLVFGCLAVLHGRPPRVVPSLSLSRFALQTPLQGLSALALAVMSISAGVALEVHYPAAGVLAVTIAFVLFALRTSARELQLHAAHNRLQHSASHDSLTGLANRAELRRLLSNRLDPRNGRETQLSLFFIDLDRFKTINDSLGHAFGDRLLISVARSLRSLARPGDVVARLGGDEFVVMAECASADQAQALADTLVQHLRQPIQLQGRVLHVTASVGVVFGQAGMDPDDLLRNADCAMYVAKHRGKNQAKLFENSMAEQANNELWLETDLRQAIHEGGISVQYQPIYSLQRGSVVGFEALARWSHPTRGMISPAAFIPAAEETGLILELGQQVLREACRQIQKWNESTGRDFSVSVNVSARQFADSTLLAKIKQALALSGLPAQRLKLEITESVLLSGIDSVEVVLNAARDLGVEISLDDFGTGYSSLSYLLRFPFDVVKIDRSFVQALDQNTQRADLTSTIVHLAAKLGKKVVAEGVETEGERQCLEDMSCDLLQGYLFSKPLPAAAIERLLEQDKQMRHKQVEPRQPAWATPLLSPGATLTAPRLAGFPGPASPVFYAPEAASVKQFS